MNLHSQRGFTLVELVVALALAVLVVGFAGMFIAAPLKSYDAAARRAELAADLNQAWPLLQEDLRQALPNSVRVQRNGQIVVLEMLAAIDWARYRSTPTAPFTTAGTFRGVTVPFNSTAHFLSINNLGAGVPGADAYALAGSMTSAGSRIVITTDTTAGQQRVTVTPAPTFTADSARRRAFLVSGPVTWLCDAASGDLMRFSGYAIASNQLARDTPVELTGAGASMRLITRGISSCDFIVGGGGITATQVISARFTGTRGNDVLQLAGQLRTEHLP
jgi:MSHA biogenesis protein MshO